MKGLGFGARIDRKEEQTLGEILAKIEPTDLVKFGMIPEFVGRVPIIATLSDLSEEDLVTILTQPKNALTKQYVKLFEMEKVKPCQHHPRGAARLCARGDARRKSGARGLRAILEQAMLDIMYDVPYREGVKECKITEGTSSSTRSRRCSPSRRKRSSPL